MKHQDGSAKANMIREFLKSYHDTFASNWIFFIVFFSLVASIMFVSPLTTLIAVSNQNYSLSSAIAKANYGLDSSLAIGSMQWVDNPKAYDYRSVDLSSESVIKIQKEQASFFSFKAFVPTGTNQITISDENLTCAESTALVCTQRTETNDLYASLNETLYPGVNLLAGHASLYPGESEFYISRSYASKLLKLDDPSTDQLQTLIGKTLILNLSFPSFSSSKNMTIFGVFNEKDPNLSIPLSLFSSFVLVRSENSLAVSSSLIFETSKNRESNLGLLRSISSSFPSSYDKTLHFSFFQKNEGSYSSTCYLTSFVNSMYASNSLAIQFIYLFGFVFLVFGLVLFLFLWCFSFSKKGIVPPKKQFSILLFLSFFLGCLIATVVHAVTFSIPIYESYSAAIFTPLNSAAFLIVFLGIFVFVFIWRKKLFD